MNLRVTLLATMLALTSSCLAQTGTVTFYSVAQPLKDQFKAGVKLAVTFKGTIPSFAGWLYDGNDRMAHAEAGHFMTFHVPSGLHSFSASYGRKRPGPAAIQLNVESDHVYCVRLSSEYWSAVVVPLMGIKGVIDEVGCEQAFHEAGESKPLNIKRVDKIARGELDASTSFPKEN